MEASASKLRAPTTTLGQGDGRTTSQDLANGHEQASPDLGRRADFGGVGADCRGRVRRENGSFSLVRTAIDTASEPFTSTINDHLNVYDQGE